jgi:hypothetical protein
MSKWSEILDTVADAIEDLSSLEVVTLTGDVKSNIDDSGNIKWDELIKTAKNAGGAVEMVAATHISIDSDTVQFVTNSAPTNMEQLMQLHDAAIETAQNNRQAVIELVKGLV